MKECGLFELFLVNIWLKLGCLQDLLDNPRRLGKGAITCPARGIVSQKKQAPDMLAEDVEMTDFRVVFLSVGHGSV